MYTVIFSEKAAYALAKLDKSGSSFIFAWIQKTLVNTQNPRMHGKALTGNLSGFWRYRVGKYRLLADIRDSEILIEIVSVGCRANIYDN